MPRNGGGGYTLPQAAFTPGTTISSTAVNSDFSDIATALTGSLARDGQGGMTAVLPLDDTGATYISDPDTGLHRTAANTQALECGGVDVMTASASAVNFSVPITSGGISVTPPVGAGALWFAAPPPSGWLICNGASLLRAGPYAPLFAIIGTTFGAPDGTHFNLPNFTGRVPVGLDTGSVNIGGATAIGNVGGAKEITLDTTMIPAHFHGNSLNDPGHLHTIGSITSPTQGAGAPVNVLQTSGAGVNTGSSTTGISITNANAGGGLPHANVQPFLTINVIIYAGV